MIAWGTINEQGEVILGRKPTPEEIASRAADPGWNGGGPQS